MTSVEMRFDMNTLMRRRYISDSALTSPCTHSSLQRYADDSNNSQRNVQQYSYETDVCVCVCVCVWVSEWTVEQRKDGHVPARRWADWLSVKISQNKTWLSLANTTECPPRPIDRSRIRILRIFFILKILRILRFFSVEKKSQKNRNFANHGCLTCFDVLECKVHL